MRIAAAGIALLLLFYQLHGQQCATAAYQQLHQHNINGNRAAVADHDNAFISLSSARTYPGVIIIPVVVHILYHANTENITNEVVQKQIDVLNRDFRRMNADTVNTPAAFKSLAADCEIEFRLAAVDPAGRATSGIIHQYTPVLQWQMDDKIKFSKEAGDDAWDAKSYLNIWVGNIHGLKGYSTFPGTDAGIDGVVINTNFIGTRTLVHETGHWLGLKHIWGDAYCGDDQVDDTPKQSTFTPGCPSSIRITCSNTSGDMYMNYMDLTDDACLNLFTQGQKQKMRSLFAAGGARQSMLLSNALAIPLSNDQLVDDAPPQWLQPKIYPNPASTEITFNVEYDYRWIGKEIVIINMLRQVEEKIIIRNKIQKINISKLKPGMYFIKGEKEGEKIMQKFIKL